MLIYSFYYSGLLGCIVLGYNSSAVSVYGSGGLMFLVYSSIIPFHWSYCSGSREEESLFFWHFFLFLLDYCSRECIVLICYFYCFSLSEFIVLNYSSGIVTVSLVNVFGLFGIFSV